MTQWINFVFPFGSRWNYFIPFCILINYEQVRQDQYTVTCMKLKYDIEFWQQYDGKSCTWIFRNTLASPMSTKCTLAYLTNYKIAPICICLWSIVQKTRHKNTPTNIDTCNYLLLVWVWIFQYVSRVCYKYKSYTTKDGEYKVNTELLIPKIKDCVYGKFKSKLYKIVWM